MEKKAYAFVFAGFFITEKDPQEIFREDVTAQDMEEIERLVKEKLFKPGVDVALAPSIVPPHQANDLLQEFSRIIFGRGEENA
ncbi:hypothetical protein [Sulfurihydrogenibium azorense]|jgi:hypothetical protein|uniref:Uncharacterized protein n=1 Tax=Sulfurihydrogenibium azorense (strain DSM 15241 / OCM 825 / Az-Fu1) TaxID=204536 RepID=C1DWF4_SULAA|nr:hypothetical protein [Sulfurihydrogenibium azorense]ACN99780.1 hypothetical protein SULAZ_1474 [Sulfurihydrogenibium azorense Az-Fu1]MDM7273337.1 hypothetical protein [Sulfurihydrogenibium azorense]